MAFRHLPLRVVLSPTTLAKRTFSVHAPLLAARAPSLSDIQPDKGSEFDARQQRWRKEVSDAAARKAEADRKEHTRLMRNMTADILVQERLLPPRMAATKSLAA